MGPLVVEHHPHRDGRRRRPGRGRGHRLGPHLGGGRRGGGTEVGTGEAAPLVVPGAHPQRPAVGEDDGQRGVQRADLLDLQRGAVGGDHRVVAVGVDAVVGLAVVVVDRLVGTLDGDLLRGDAAERDRADHAADDAGGPEDLRQDAHVAPPTWTPRHPGADAGDDLVVDGVAGGGPVRRGRLTATAVAEQRHRVTRLHLVVPHVDHHLVHRHPAGDAVPPAADGDLGPRTRRPRHTVGVPDRDQRQRGVGSRPVGETVGDAGAGRDPFGQRHRRPQCHRRPESVGVPEPGAVERVEAVDADAHPDQVVAGVRGAHRRGGVGQVPVPRGQPGVGGGAQRGLEHRPLLADARVADHLGAAEVAHHALDASAPRRVRRRRRPGTAPPSRPVRRHRGRARCRP